MRILLASSWFPYPPDNGSRVRVYNLLRQLAKRHEVTIVSFTQATPSPQAVTVLQSYAQAIDMVPEKRFEPASWKAIAGLLAPFPRSVIATFSLDMHRRLRSWLKDRHWDLAIASEAGVAPYLVSARLPRILDDLETTMIRDLPAQGHSPLHRWRYRLTWAKYRNYAARLISQFSACTVVSEIERAHAAEITRRGRIAVVPNGLDLADYCESYDPPVPDTLIFTGVLRYHANHDALRFFLQQVWPLVRQRRPAAQLRVTGGLEEVAVADLPTDGNVVFTGYLPDIRPAVARSWLSIVPLRIGGGTRVKILESMALGTPVVTTTKGAEGLDVVSEQDLLVADEPAELAAAVVQLLSSQDLRAQLAAAGRELVARKYDWNIIGQSFQALMEEIVQVRNR